MKELQNAAEESSDQSNTIETHLDQAELTAAQPCRGSLHYIQRNPSL